MQKNVLSFILLAFLSVQAALASTAPPTEIGVSITAKGTPAQVMRITRHAETLKAVINHPEFEKRVRGARTKSGAAFSYSKKSGDQVFTEIQEGAELGGLKDSHWQLTYEFKPQKRKCVFGKCSAWVLGWTYPNLKTVYINSLTWDNRDDCGVIGTMAHEQLHKLRFTHPSKKTPTRYLSPPYAVGTIASEVCQKYFKHNF